MFPFCCILLICPGLKIDVDSGFELKKSAAYTIESRHYQLFGETRGVGREREATKHTFERKQVDDFPCPFTGTLHVGDDSLVHVKS